VKFFLGTHQPHWLTDERFEGVPLFISRRRLQDYRTLPRAMTDFALDSGGFTELQLHGRWLMDADAYADQVLAYAGAYGKRLKWVAPQDWMCEPIVIKGGSGGRGVVLGQSGRSHRTHRGRRR
jgi:hypothetical protein